MIILQPGEEVKTHPGIIKAKINALEEYLQHLAKPKKSKSQQKVDDPFYNYGLKNEKNLSSKTKLSNQPTK